MIIEDDELDEMLMNIFNIEEKIIVKKLNKEDIFKSIFEEKKDE